VALKAHPGVFGAHAAAVVGDGDEFPSGLDNPYFYPGGPCVQTVFHKLFDDRGRTFDYFSSGNLVDEILWKKVDFWHGWELEKSLCQNVARITVISLFISYDWVIYSVLIWRKIWGAEAMRGMEIMGEKWVFLEWDIQIILDFIFG
jgi:hypothetical protein